MTDILFKDVCVGKIAFSAYGGNIEFEIWSTYDGRMLARVICLDAKSISIKNPDVDEEHEEFLFGAYIAPNGAIGAKQPQKCGKNGKFEHHALSKNAGLGENAKKTD